jgi:hypothetical protein
VRLYQQLPSVEFTLIKPPNAPISLDQVLSSSSIISFSMLSVFWCQGDCPFYKLWHVRRMIIQSSPIHHHR